MECQLLQSQETGNTGSQGFSHGTLQKRSPLITRHRLVRLVLHSGTAHLLVDNMLIQDVKEEVLPQPQDRQVTSELDFFYYGTVFPSESA